MHNKKYLWMIIPALLLVACSGNEEKADAYGNFEATEITISAQGSGELMQFNLEEGDHLKAGTFIGWIDTTDLSLKKQQFRAQEAGIRSKIATLNAQAAVYAQQRRNAVRDLNRFEAMLKDSAATQKQVDDMQGQVEVIDKQIQSVDVQKKAVNSEIDAVRKQIAQVEEAIHKSIIRQPVDGTVLTKYVNAHEVVVPGKPLYKFADLREIKLKVYVSGAQLPYLKIGQQVQVLVDKNAKENRSLTGTVSWISENAEFTPKIIQTKKERVNLVYAVKVLVKNDGTLKIGMPGEINFMPKEND